MESLHKPLGLPALESSVRSNYRQSRSTRRGSPLPANVPKAKHSFEQEKNMKDASVKKGERKRCKEGLTENEMRFVDVHDSF